jgi:hypothetical protein
VEWHRFSGPLRAGALAAVVVAAAAAEGAGSQQLVAAGAVLAWWSVIVALAVGRLRGRPPAPVPLAAIVVGACLVALAALSFVSMGWASDGGRAFAVAVQGALYAGVFVLVVLLSSPGAARPWLGGLALGLAAVCAVALTSRLLPGIDADAGLFEALQAAQGRLSFPIGYWNGLGALAALALVLLSWIGARGGGRLERAVATAAIPLPALALYLTFSRGAMAAAAVGMVTLVALGPARTRIVGTAAIGLGGGGALIALASARPDLRDDLPTSAADSQGLEVLIATVAALLVVGILRYVLDVPLGRARIPRIAAAAAASIAAIALVAGVAAADPGRWIEEFQEPPGLVRAEDPTADRQLATVSGRGRWQFWGVAVDAFREEPVRGLGAGGFQSFWNQHGPIEGTIEHAHSIFLDHLAELGPLGLLLILGALGAALASALSRRAVAPGGEAGVAGALVVTATFAFAIDWSWSIPAVALPLLVALAVVTGPATMPPLAATSGAREGERRRSGIGLATITILFAWGVMWAGGVSLLTELRLSQSQAAAARGELADAASQADDAVTLQPWAAEPRLQLGLVRELEGELPAAREHLIQAVDRAPEDWRVWFVLARVEGALGNTNAARSARDRAYMLLPSTPTRMGDNG